MLIMRFEIALEDCVPLRGDNELGIVLQTKAKRPEVPYMEELDIVVEIWVFGKGW